MTHLDIILLIVAVICSIALIILFNNKKHPIETPIKIEKEQEYTVFFKDGSDCTLTEREINIIVDDIALVKEISIIYDEDKKIELLVRISEIYFIQSKTQ